MIVAACTDDWSRDAYDEMGDVNNISGWSSLKYHQGDQICHTNWVRLARNETNLRLFQINFSTFWLGETNLGLFKISFSTFLLAEPKCTETDLKKSQICPISG